MIRALFALLLLVGLCHGQETSSDPFRSHLAKTAPPWYDAEHDTWRRVELPEPPQPREGSTSRSEGWINADLFAVVIISLAVIAAAWLLWKAWQSGASSGPVDAPTPGVRIAPGSDLSALPEPMAAADPETALAEAKRRGDWDAAVVWIYVRLLLALGAAGAVRLAPGTTNRAHLNAARSWAAGKPSRTSVHRTAKRSVAVFESIRFGGEHADAALVADLERAADAAHRQLAQEHA